MTWALIVIGSMTIISVSFPISTVVVVVIVIVLVVVVVADVDNILCRVSFPHTVASPSYTAVITIVVSIVVIVVVVVVVVVAVVL